MVTQQGRPLHNEHASGRAPRMGANAVYIGLVQGWNERARIKDALRHRAEVTFVDQIGGVWDALREEQRELLGLIVEPSDRDGRLTDGLVRDVRDQLPDLPVAGYCRSGPGQSEGIRALAAAGVHELIFQGVDDAGISLRSALLSASHACAAEAVLLQLQQHIPDYLRPFASFAVRNPGNAKTVNEVASAIGLNRRTWVNYCMRARFFPPAELLGWCRLLMAAHYLASTMRTVESIALQLDFPSDTALRNMMKRYTGLRARDVSAQGGVARVLQSMLDSLRAHRMLDETRATNAR